MRGDREKASLNRVKEYLFCHKEKQFDLMMSPYYYEINDDDVLENIREYIKARRVAYKGMVFDDIQEIFNALVSAKPNPESNKFPDFLFENGFIEHFQVTSSIENKSGSKKAEFEAMFKREIKSEQEEFRKKLEVSYLCHQEGCKHNKDHWCSLGHEAKIDNNGICYSREAK